MLTLQLPLRLGITGIKNDPADLQLPTERQERLARLAAAGDRRLSVPDQLLRPHPQPLEVARQPREDVRRLLAEDQGAGERPRPARLARDDPPTAGLPITDRDVPARLPQIALDQLRRPINRPLERALHQEPRPHLAHVVIEDRLAARIADLPSKLPQPLRGDLRIGLQLLTDPVLERIHDRHRRCPRIPRRRLGRQQPRDRVPRQPRPATNLPRRQPLHPLHPPHLSPLLHANHRLPPVRSKEIKRASRPSRTPRPPHRTA